MKKEQLAFKNLKCAL